MKTVLAVSLALLGCVVANPGGYTGIGGVYKNMKLGAETMELAKKASKMAIDIYNDESLSFGEEQRNVRNVEPYIPTFYTSHPQPQVDASNLPELVRNNRGAQTHGARSYSDLYAPANPEIYY